RRGQQQGRRRGVLAEIDRAVDPGEIGGFAEDHQELRRGGAAHPGEGVVIAGEEPPREEARSVPTRRHPDRVEGCRAWPPDHGNLLFVHNLQTTKQKQGRTRARHLHLVSDLPLYIRRRAATMPARTSARSCGIASNANPASISRAMPSSLRYQLSTSSLVPGPARSASRPAAAMRVARARGPREASSAAAGS